LPNLREKNKLGGALKKKLHRADLGKLGNITKKGWVSVAHIAESLKDRQLQKLGKFSILQK
jgi:hypothetical protein